MRYVSQFFLPHERLRANFRRILHAEGHRIATPAWVDPHLGDQAEREVWGRHPDASDLLPIRYQNLRPDPLNRFWPLMERYESIGYLPDTNLLRRKR